MKVWNLSLILILLAFTANGQINYVLNPSFEEYTQCPSAINQLEFAKYWKAPDSIYIQPYCAGEYINKCANPISPVGIPGSLPGPGVRHHYARLGNGMAQFAAFFDESNPNITYKRDYIQGHLVHSLVAGQSYCVTFYVWQWAYYANDHIGAYFDNGIMDTVNYGDCARVRTDCIPQVYQTGIIKDTLTDSTGWNIVQGTFIASGTERFITIGNFFDKSSTSYVLTMDPQDTNGMAASGLGYSYYILDDVSVIASNTLPHAGNDTTIYAGDSTFIGPHEIALPYQWYVQGHPNPIDSGGGIWVHPDTTTTYILQQTLCGLNTFDTVVITVIHDTIPDTTPVDTTNIVQSIQYNSRAIIYPNPASNKVTLSNLHQGTQVQILNMLGQAILTEEETKGTKKEIDIHTLPAGTYYIQLTYACQRVVRKLTITR